jgi:hypothetical protein
MNGIRSVMLVVGVDVEVAGPGPRFEPRDRFVLKIKKVEFGFWGINKVT